MVFERETEAQRSLLNWKPSRNSNKAWFFFIFTRRLDERERDVTYHKMHTLNQTFAASFIPDGLTNLQSLCWHFCTEEWNSRNPNFHTEVAAVGCIPRKTRFFDDSFILASDSCLMCDYARVINFRIIIIIIIIIIMYSSHIRVIALAH